jgi:hypothetical protein
MFIRQFGHLAAFLTVAFVAYAQVTSTAPLSGTVVDPSGSTIPEAAVTVQNKVTGTAYQAVTSANGTFTVPALGTGLYSVTATA